MKAMISAAGILLLFSCQKELSQEPVDSGLPMQAGQLLTRNVVTDQADNLDYLVRTFTYDDAFRISTIATTFRTRQGGGNIREITRVARFIRDATGRITEIRSEPDTASFFIRFQYSAAQSDALAYANVYRKNGPSRTLLDSTVYVYGPGGRVERTSQYFLNVSNQLELVNYQTYRYDVHGNITERQQWQDDDGDGVFEASIRYRWTYDDKKNPQYTGEDAYFYWSYHWPTAGSPANITRQENDYPGTPDDELAYTFEYNPAGLPMVETRLPDRNVVTRYYYD